MKVKKEENVTSAEKSLERDARARAGLYQALFDFTSPRLSQCALATENNPSS